MSFAKYEWERIETQRVEYNGLLCKGSFSCQDHRAAKYKRSWNPMGVSLGLHRVITLVALEFPRLNRGGLEKAVTNSKPPPKYLYCL